MQTHLISCFGAVVSCVLVVISTATAFAQGTPVKANLNDERPAARLRVGEGNVEDLRSRGRRGTRGDPLLHRKTMCAAQLDHEFRTGR